MTQNNTRKEAKSVSARPSIVFFVWSLLAMTSCVTPKYVRPSIETPAAYRETTSIEVNTTWHPAKPQDGSTRAKWWKAFEDPQLDSLEDQLESSNENIASAVANFVAARALVKQTRAQYFPTVNTTAGYANVRPSSTQFGLLQQANQSATVKSLNEYSLAFDASWEPDFWTRVRNTVKANVYGAQASAADMANVRLSEEAELAVDYFELRTQDSLKGLLDATVDAYAETLHLTESQAQAGIGSDEAVAEAEAQLNAARAQDTNLTMVRAQYEHAIAVLIGKPAPSFSLMRESLNENVPEIPAGVPSELLERRPDIAEAERAVAEANAAIGIARTAYFPAVALSASAGFGNSTAGDWLAWPSRFWSVGPSLVETIFDAGARKATVQISRANYDRTVANYRESSLIAFQQVEDNLVALQVLAESIRQQQAAADAAARSLREATVRYHAGIDPYLNVIVAQTTLLNNQQAVFNFRMQRITAAIQLIKALGGGWDVTQMPSARTIKVDDSRSP